MASLKEIIYSVKESVKSFSDDSDISLEYLKYKVETTRAMLLAQRFSSRSFIIPNVIRQHFYHTLELSEENEFVSGLGSVLRTVNPIQVPLEPFNLKNNIRITSGSYSDISFTFVDTNRFPYVGRSKWNSNQIYVCLGSDFRLYFTSNNPKVKMIEQVKLSEVTASPEAAYPYTIEYNPSVDFEDVTYPLNSELIVELTDIIIKHLQIPIASREDKQNDSQDNGDR